MIQNLSRIQGISRYQLINVSYVSLLDGNHETEINILEWGKIISHVISFITSSFQPWFSIFSTKVFFPDPRLTWFSNSFFLDLLKSVSWPHHWLPGPTLVVSPNPLRCSAKVSREKGALSSTANHWPWFKAANHLSWSKTRWQASKLGWVKTYLCMAVFHPLHPKTCNLESR